jgi:hypothetical protein
MSSDTHGFSAPAVPPDEASAISGGLNRREVVGGAVAMVLVAGQVRAADTAEPTIRMIRDETAPNEFGVAIAFPERGYRDEFVLFRRVFTDRWAESPRAGIPIACDR